MAFPINPADGTKFTFGEWQYQFDALNKAWKKYTPAIAGVPLETELGMNQPQIQGFDTVVADRGVLLWTDTPSYNSWIGYDFKVTTDKMLVAIRFFALSSTSKLGIWDVATKTKIADWAATGTGDWVDFTLPTPVTLKADVAYFLGTYTNSSPGHPYYLGVGSGYTKNGIVFIDGRTALANGDVWPINNGGGSMYSRLHPVVTDLSLSAKVTDLSSTAGTKTRSIAFHLHGDQAAETGAVSFIAPQALTITDIRVSVDTAPAGAALTIDVNKNGTTMYTTQANRPSIAAGATSATATLPDVKTMALGDKISIDIDQVGSTTAGKNLNVTLICTE
jgi:hypothetical protein